MKHQHSLSWAEYHIRIWVGSMGFMLAALASVSVFLRGVWFNAFEYACIHVHFGIFLRAHMWTAMMCVKEGFPSAYTLCVLPLTHWAFIRILWVHSSCIWGSLPNELWPYQTPLPPISVPLSSLSPPPHPRLLPPSIRSLVPCQLVGRSRCEGGLGQEKEREKERGIEIHLPLVWDCIVQDLLDKPLATYTQTIMCNTQ